jgi:hypothetical protein
MPGLHQLQSNTSLITANALNTSQSSLFQHTSATSAITANAFAASATTKFAGTGTTFNGANISGSLTNNSNGIQMSLSVAPGGGGADGYNPAQFTNSTANSTQDVLWAGNSNGSGNITFGLTGSTVTASHAGYTGTTTGFFLAGNSTNLQNTSLGNIGAIVYSNQTQTSGTLVLSGSNGITVRSGNGTAIIEFDGHHMDAVIPSGNGNGTGFSSMTSGTVGLNFAGAISGSQNGNNLTISSPATSNFVATSVSSNLMGTGERGNYQYTSNSSNNTSVYQALSATTKFAGTGTTFNGANISGSLTQNSNGIQMSMSVAAPGAAAENNWVNLSGNTAGNSTASGSTINWVGGNNITLSALNGSQVRIDAAAGGAGGAGTQFSGTNISGTVDTNGMSLSVANPGGGAGVTVGGWEVFPAGNNTTFSSLSQNMLYLQKMHPEQNYSFNNFELRMSGSFVSSTNSQVVAHTIKYGLYSQDTNNSYNSIATSQMVISASYNSSTAYGITVSQGAGSYTVTSNNTALASYITGQKHLYLPFTSTITADGHYAFGILISSNSTVGTSPFRMALWQNSVINNLTIGKIQATTILASNSTFVGDFAQGAYNTTTGAMPSAVAKSQMTNAISQMRLYMQLDV